MRLLWTDTSGITDPDERCSDSCRQWTWLILTQIFSRQVCMAWWRCKNMSVLCRRRHQFFTVRLMRNQTHGSRVITNCLLIKHHWGQLWIICPNLNESRYASLVVYLCTEGTLLSGQTGRVWDRLHNGSWPGGEKRWQKLGPNNKARGS